MLPKHNKPSSNSLAGKHMLQHEALTHAASVPSTVSWMGTGGGGLVTDQAVCGSCWAFATAAALQGALWMKTGVLNALSLAHVHLLKSTGICRDHVVPLNDPCSACWHGICMQEDDLVLPGKRTFWPKAVLEDQCMHAYLPT